jgi:hypothetical protein
LSTPKWKKELRAKEHAEAKRKKEFQKKYGLTTKVKKSKEFIPLKVSKPYVRETREIPSLQSIPTGVCPPPERKVYTGDLIVGIATMHKSNAVPVMRGTSQAEDIAKMRRG